MSNSTPMINLIFKIKFLIIKMDYDFSLYKIMWPKVYYKSFEVDTFLRKLQTYDRLNLRRILHQFSEDLIYLLFSICWDKKFKMVIAIRTLLILKTVFSYEGINWDELLDLLVCLMITTKIFETKQFCVNEVH